MMYACASRADALANGVLVCPKQVAVSLLACRENEMAAGRYKTASRGVVKATTLNVSIRLEQANGEVLKERWATGADGQDMLPRTHVRLKA